MKRIVNLFVYASGMVFLLAGGIQTVQASQPAGRADQAAVAEQTIFLPLVMKAYVPKAISISTGENHACALTDRGAVKCWGYNNDGELGEGTTTNRSIPVDVAGLGSGVAAISAGYKHTCALTNAGGVKCWGYNPDGRLGNGTTASSATPVDVTGLGGVVTAISAGGFHTCALMQSGAVKCWGANDFGQLGNGTTTASTIPVSVNGLTSGVTAIRAGGTHTCALQAGGIKCWGNNGFGQLGNGTTTQSNVPGNVTGLTSGVSAISAGGDHTCALTAGNGLLCWGRNDYGQLGDGTTTQRKSPVNVSGLGSGVSTVSAGARHSCARIQTGGAMCWGFNFYGQIGDGTTLTRLAPVNVSGLPGGLGSIQVGNMYTCALLSSGGIRCWGNNDFGQLGNNSSVSSITPVTVVGFP
jgi:alpha-tubulin suppressor-like RCC1 family protein